ncbi:MAG: hypothetical protein IPP03_01560 [Dechloromonas sp.]|nr:hypothetical protein [Candidatus Dechloromonas phosphoritropha]
MHILDRIWQRHDLKGKLQAHIVRYADDFVVMCRKSIEEPMKVVRHVLDRLGLSLNEAKTHIVNATEASFNFLDFTIQMSRGAKAGKPYPNVTGNSAAFFPAPIVLSTMSSSNHETRRRPGWPRQGKGRGCGVARANGRRCCRDFRAAV